MPCFAWGQAEHIVALCFAVCSVTPVLSKKFFHPERILLIFKEKYYSQTFC
jgi:hypothetical protein